LEDNSVNTSSKLDRALCLFRWARCETALSQSDPETTALVQRITELLRELERPPERDPSEIRRDVLRLAEAVQHIRRLGRVRMVNVTSAKAASKRILAYMRLFVGEVIQGKELQVVSGIQEFARRVRELRVQQGYNISTGNSREDLRPDQYVLESPDPDTDAARKWQTANTIRRQGGSARDRILTFLRTNVRTPVTGEQLAYVANVGEVGRRTRELRTEYGYRVATRFTGRPDLPGGVYILESEDQLPPHDRHIPDAIYDEVLKRDGYRCCKCRWSLQQRRPEEKRQFLEVHHIEHHRAGGPNNLENLITLCNVDHDEVHRLDLSGQAFFEWLGRGISGHE
jgi:hypothetical protein